MSYEFRIPAKALALGAGQITLDGNVEEFEPEHRADAALRELEGAPGEAGAIADLDALERAGMGRWLV